MSGTGFVEGQKLLQKELDKEANRRITKPVGTISIKNIEASQVEDHKLKVGMVMRNSQLEIVE